MSPITTHVLDIARGQPAEGMGVVLEQRGRDGSWSSMACCATNADGRIMDFLPDGTPLTAGIYRLRFATADYFAAFGIRAFYPEVQVTFAIDDAVLRYHVPLLLSPFGYSTYRGS
jgi:5-hydroxyisourate hydrolase